MSGQPVNEELYPIQPRWVFERIAHVVWINIILVSYAYGRFHFDSSTINNSNLSLGLIIFLAILEIIVACVLAITVGFIKLSYFHYSLEENFITIRQGVIYRSERHVPYARIQNVIQRQNLLDRLFGVSDLVIQDATQAMAGVAYNGMGSRGNTISIPGLLVEDARALKQAILKKIETTPQTDTISGL